jgi:hypothetical protein
MRQNNNNPKRSRGRNSGRKGGNSRNQIFDSNGPSVRIRGHALQIFEKYQQLSRDASSSGDRVGAENLQQHAEHYYRVAAAAGAIPSLKTTESDTPVARNDSANTQNGSQTRERRNNGSQPVAESSQNGNGHENSQQNRDAGAESVSSESILETTVNAESTNAHGAAENAEIADDRLAGDHDTTAPSAAEPEAKGSKPASKGRRRASSGPRESKSRTATNGTAESGTEDSNQQVA